MDEKKASKQMEAVLRQKIEEFDSMDLEGDPSKAKDAAEALAKAADVQTKLEQEDRNKKEWIFKGLTILGGIVGTALAALIKALSDQKINDKQLAYLDESHMRAYEFEENGKTEHMIVSPAAKDALRERPKKL